jgi:hypothetical protein
MIHRMQPTAATPQPFIDLGDIVSLGLALIAVLIVALSFYTPHASNADTIQFFTNGYDNNAHYGLMRATANTKGYVYYSPGNNKGTIFNAYPQGWHLASGNIANGFGANLFSYSSPLSGIYAYMAILGTWYVLMVYAFTIVGWRLLTGLGETTKKMHLDALLVFAMGNLLIQLVLFWGALTFGFSSYIGCIAYLILIGAMIIEHSQRKSLAYFAVAALSLIAVTQAWLLPFPAMLVTIFLGFHKRQSLSSTLRSFREERRLWALSALGAAALFASLFQVWVILAYGGSVATQIVTDGGIFGISNILVGFVVVSSYIFWFHKRDKNSRRLGDAYLSIIAPTLVLSLAIYAFEILQSGGASYYFVKTFGLVFCFGGLFFVPAFCEVIAQHAKDSPLPFKSSILGASALALLLIGSGQTTNAFDGLLQRGSRLTYNSSVAISRYLSSGTSGHISMIVLRNYSFTEDNNGTLFAGNAAYNGETCLNAVTSDSVTPLNARIKSLDKCALRSSQQIDVLTSNHTQPLIQALHQQKITAIHIQN